MRKGFLPNSIAEKKWGEVAEKLRIPPGNRCLSVFIRGCFFPLVNGYAIEDAHAHESSVLDRAVEDLSRNDLVIADRYYCIVQFLAAIAARCGFFFIRQHGRLKEKLLGNRKRVGKMDSGVVYEQTLKISDGEHTLEVRRITVELAEPTREGDVCLQLCR